MALVLGHGCQGTANMNRKLVTMTKCIVLVAVLLTSSEQAAHENLQKQPGTRTSPNSVGRVVKSLGANLTTIFQDSRGHHWFGGLRTDEGIYRSDGKRVTLFSTMDGLCSDSILRILEDEKGSLYFDTPKGVSQFDGHTFTTLKVTEGSNKDWKLGPSDLWFSMGTERDGPYRYDGKTLYHLRFPEIDRAKEFRAMFPNATWSPYGIYTMYKDKRGAMWFGTASLGACRYDGKAHSWLYESQLTATPSGGDFGIRSIIQDKAGSFWFCNPRFRYEVLPKRATGDAITYRTKPGVAHSGKGDVPYFMSIAEDSKGHLWMATYDNGVWRTDGKELIHYPIKDSETKVLLFSVYTDRMGAIWLGTHNAGVFKFDGKQFARFLAP